MLTDELVWRKFSAFSASFSVSLAFTYKNKTQIILFIIKASTQAQLINLFTEHHHGLLEEFDLYLAEKLNSLL